MIPRFYLFLFLLKQLHALAINMERTAWRGRRKMRSLFWDMFSLRCPCANGDVRATCKYQRVVNGRSGLETNSGVNGIWMDLRP